jgi:hypothetical protein
MEKGDIRALLQVLFCNNLQLSRPFFRQTFLKKIIAITIMVET